jgi:uncharacterized membrane protein YraQ (UPF0718 family)
MIGLLRRHWLLVFTAGLYLAAFALAPERAVKALAVGATVFGTVLPLIIAVFGLVGLLQVWIDQNLVARLLGREGGVKALLLAALSGTLLVGPSYLIFPLLLGLHRQGARLAVIATFLTSYAVKLQMIPVEMGFLGWPFSLGRAAITLGLAIPIGLLVEALVERRPGSR